jgi:RHS repeat-associated protein
VRVECDLPGSFGKPPHAGRGGSRASEFPLAPTFTRRYLVAMEGARQRRTLGWRTRAAGEPRRLGAVTRRTPVQVAGSRYYSPGLGRWASRDPIGEEGGVNQFACLDNSPLMQVDALGLAPCCCCCAISLYHIEHGVRYRPPGHFSGGTYDWPFTVNVTTLYVQTGGTSKGGGCHLSWRERWVEPSTMTGWNQLLGEWRDTSYMVAFNSMSPPRRCPRAVRWSGSDAPGTTQRGRLREVIGRTTVTHMEIEVELQSTPGCSCPHRGLALSIDLQMRWDGLLQQPDPGYAHFNVAHRRW